MKQKNVYVQFIRDWFALILLGVLVSVGATYFALGERVPLYQASSTLQVGRMLDDKSPTQNDLAVAERLVPAYGELARRDPVLDATINSLGLSMTPDDIRGQLLVTAAPRTQLIDIQVVNADPDLAAAIANEVAHQVVLHSPETATDDASYTFLQTQLEDLQAKILQAQQETAELDEQILTLSSATQLFEVRERHSLLNAQIDTWQTTYGILLAAAEPGHANVVQIAAFATPPSTPLPGQASLYYGLAVVVGGGLATLLALGLTTFGRRLKEPDELREMVGSVPIVSIPRYPVPRDGVPVALKDAFSSASSSYRILRNTLRVHSFDSDNFTMAVTSTRPGEGKTTTVANLGVTLANSGRSVLLVDANLRNPELDMLLDVETGLGFSDLLLGDATVKQVLVPTEHDGLFVIGSGTIPMHFADVLSSACLGAVVKSLGETANMVIFDTPAVFQEQESQLLVQHVDGVLVVAEAGRLGSSEFEATLECLRSANAWVMAVVLNKTREVRWTSDRLPWSREARIAKRAEARRRGRMQPEPVVQRADESSSMSTTAD